MENKKYEFWTDKIARDIETRSKFYYTDKKMPEFKKFVVKTSASLSGVLHIGRLSDTIRGDAVFRSLKDSGVKAELIWVGEDMDPLRKVPEGVPKSYVEHIGKPVTDIPDPDGCHKSYAEHHMEEYFKVLDNFVSTKMKKFSMREEYKKGNFTKYVKILLKNIEELKEIQNKYRREELAENWSPWTPICDNCGKIITPRVTGFEKGKVSYICQDYAFEKYVAKGCGYEGVNDPLKANGKLMWKSEWAAQWVRWKVCSEGAGKEYQVPGSAFWVNGEIVEKIFKFPMPVPIFYEYLTVDGKKMSASIGNVVYPNDWLQVAPPQLLRLIFLKDPMRERDFTWMSTENLMDEIDELEKIYYGIKKVDNKRDEITMKRLFEMIQLGKMPLKYKAKISYSLFIEIAKILPEKNQEKFVMQKLKEYGHLKESTKELVRERLEYAKNLLKRIGGKPKSHVELADEEKMLIRNLISMIEKESNAENIQMKTFEIIKASGMKVSDGFKLIYRILLNSERGPRLGAYITEVGKEEIINKLKEVL